MLETSKASQKSELLNFFGFYRDMWKDKNNSFREDEETLLKSIPTLLRWKHERKLQLKTLEENELLNEKYLKWFFYVQENYSKKKDSNDHTERYELKNHDEFVNFAKNFNSKEKLLSFYFYGEKNETVRNGQKCLSIIISVMLNIILRETLSVLTVTQPWIM